MKIKDAGNKFMVELGACWCTITPSPETCWCTITSSPETDKSTEHYHGRLGEGCRVGVFPISYLK